MEDGDGNSMFAFQDLDYIPFGYGSVLAPYIETPAATMRAAATLMRLGLGDEALSGEGNIALSGGVKATEVICDLGCGDGDFRTA